MIGHRMITSRRNTIATWRKSSYSGCNRIPSKLCRHVATQATNVNVKATGKSPWNSMNASTLSKPTLMPQLHHPLPFRVDREAALESIVHRLRLRPHSDNDKNASSSSQFISRGRGWFRRRLVVGNLRPMFIPYWVVEPSGTRRFRCEFNIHLRPPTSGMNDIPLMPTEGALGAAAVAHRAVRRKMGADGMFLTDKRTLQFEFAVCPRVLQCASATVMEVPLQMAADVTVLEAMMDGDGANNAGSAGDGHGRPRDAKVSPPKDVIVDAFAMRVSPDLLSEGTGSATAKPKRTQPQQQTKTWRDRIIGYTASQSAHRAQLHDSRKLHGQLQEAADAEARSIISFAVAKHFPGYKVRAIKCKVEPVSNEKGVRVDQSDCASVTRLHYPMWVAESSLEGDDDPRRRFHTAVDGIYGVCLGQRPRPLLMLPWFGAGTAFALPTGCFLIDPTLAAFQTLSTAIDALANASSPVLIMMALFTAVPPFLARTTNRFVFERVVADDLAQRRALVPERRDAASLGVDLVRNLTFEAERAGERAVDKVAQRIREALVGKE